MSLPRLQIGSILVIALLPGLIGAQGVSRKNAGASGTKSPQESGGGRNHKQRLFRAGAWESFLEDHQTAREKQQLFRILESRERKRDEKAREKK
ncbi:MAG: hypothetical protein O7J95_08885 [Planctomycetota bacterium]|nr:hypothetical protein [Planctomycetota bacterium]